MNLANFLLYPLMNGFLSTTLLLCMVHLLPAQEWKLVEHKDNIIVHTRKLDGQSIKDLKINTTFNTTISELVAALEDFSVDQSWVKNTIFSRKLEELSVSQFYFHTATDLPFPAKDRDAAVLYTRVQDPDTRVVRIDYEGAADKVPVDADYVRVPSLTAYYILTPISASQIDVEYYLRTDPGGSIPNWIINMALSIGPTETMQALREVLSSGRYAEARVPGLIDPFN